VGEKLSAISLKKDLFALPVDARFFISQEPK